MRSDECIEYCSEWVAFAEILSPVATSVASHSHFRVKTRAGTRKSETDTSRSRLGVSVRSVWTGPDVQLDKVVRLDESAHSRVAPQPGAPRWRSIAGNVSTVFLSTLPILTSRSRGEL